MSFAVLSILAFALVAPWLHKTLGSRAGWLLALLPLSFTLYFASLIGPVSSGEVVQVTAPWVSGLNVNFSFYIDGLGLLMALLVSGIGTLIVIYASGYLAGDGQLGRLYLLLLLFMGSMLGVVLADNILLLFIFWELTSITSYLLIGFKHDKAISRQSALQALLVTGSGGLALLAGLVMLGVVGGSWEFSTLRLQADIRQSQMYLPVLILILLGAFTKSAQFPFHFWLPNAMAAPTPVSAYLHSATMVKAGVYLLARMQPILGGSDAWLYALGVVGGITALLGGWLAWQKSDLKQILAYSTISALGLLTMLLGLGNVIAFKASMVFLLAHALYKGGLFMAAGAIEHETGSRDVTQLGQLARLMPITLTAVCLGALSMAGLPPLLGFISKELVYEATLAAPVAAYGFTAVALLANILLVVASGIVLIRPFFGQPPVREPGDPETVRETSLSMWLGPLLLGLFTLLLGLFPAVVSPFIAAAAGSVAAVPVEVKLALWHGLNPMLILSIITIAVGTAVYLVYQRLLKYARRLDGTMARLGPEQWYEQGLEGTLLLAARLTRLLQNGYLRYYLIMVAAAAVGLIGFTLLSRGAIGLGWLSGLQWDARFHEVVIASIILVATLMVVQTTSRLTAVAALGVVGYCVSLLYVFFGAPDLAMTQFSIETLTVILFVLALYRLPRFVSFTGKAARVRDMIISLTVGALMTALVLAATAVPTQSRVSDYFAENSVLLAKGRNIVNVILVDFRGLDTMVEITVLVVAAIGVYAIINLKPEKPVQEEETH
ncbi:MAG: putative monovalent cation/H+ antiporter subunit A [Anaerolineaceae bacterium]|nr:putative monovalent cation/H+ antiporter subunit A [Anaerolineaceae bacterium]